MAVSARRWSASFGTADDCGAAVVLDGSAFDVAEVVVEDEPALDDEDEQPASTPKEALPAAASSSRRERFAFM